MSILRLIQEPPGKIAGSIRFEGRDLLTLSEPEMRAIRGNAISMIFQEPMTSLNPVLTVGKQIGETLRLHQGMYARTRRSSERSRCWSWSAFRRRNGGCASIRISFRAACGSA